MYCVSNNETKTLWKKINNAVYLQLRWQVLIDNFVTYKLQSETINLPKLFNET